MLRSRALLQKAAAEASKAARDAVKAGAAEAAANANANAQPVDSPSSSPPLKPLYIPLYHHKQPDLLESRRPGTASYLFHHLSSSMGAIISLCSSQASRDRFLQLTGPNNDADDDEYDGAIINPAVIGQSDMGFLKPLTLFEELNDPMYECNPEFDLNEFMNGCGWALQQFHVTKDTLISNMPKLTPEELKSVTGVEFDDKLKTDFLTIDVKDVLNIDDTAREDPNSIENAFIAMTTPAMLRYIRFEEMMRLLFISETGDGENRGWVDPTRSLMEPSSTYIPHFRVIEDDTKVNNVALLAARVEEIYPPASYSDETRNIDNDPNAPLEDDSLLPDRSHAQKSGEDKPQVVAQLEVLYELQQSGINDEDGDGKVHTRTTVMVGMFEACLDGNPNKDDGLRWRIAYYRPALEFYSTF